MPKQKHPKGTTTGILGKIGDGFNKITGGTPQKEKTQPTHKETSAASGTSRRSIRSDNQTQIAPVVWHYDQLPDDANKSPHYGLSGGTNSDKRNASTPSASGPSIEAGLYTELPPSRENDDAKTSAGEYGQYPSGTDEQKTPPTHPDYGSVPTQKDSGGVHTYSSSTTPPPSHYAIATPTEQARDSVSTYASVPSTPSEPVLEALKARYPLAVRRSANGITNEQRAMNVLTNPLVLEVIYGSERDDKIKLLIDYINGNREKPLIDLTKDDANEIAEAVLKVFSVLEKAEKNLKPKSKSGPSSAPAARQFYQPPPQTHGTSTARLQALISLVEAHIPNKANANDTSPYSIIDPVNICLYELRGANIITQPEWEALRQLLQNLDKNHDQILNKLKEIQGQQSSLRPGKD